MRYLMSLLLVGSLFAPVAALADVAPNPGTHFYSTHAEFDNLADYPAYDVYVTHEWRFGPSPALASDAVAPDAAQIDASYKSGDAAPFFAIRQSDQAKIVHKSDEEQGDVWGSLPENKPYFISATVTGKTKSDLPAGALPDSNPAAYVVLAYHIDSLSDAGFTAHFVGESRYDARANLVSGTALPKAGATVTAEPTAVANPNEVTPISTFAPVAVPAASTTPIWIAIACLGVAVIALAAKTWKK